MSCFKSKVEPEEPKKIYKLLPNESDSMALYNEGIQLMSVYSVDSSWSPDCYQKLKNRCHAIFNANEWIMGVLEQNGCSGPIQLVIKESRLNTDNFVEERVIGTTLFDKNSSHADRNEIVKSCQMKTAYEIMAEGLNLGGFFILRDQEEIAACKNIAIIFSLNHIVGDGGTIFKLFNMLDQSSEVRSLNRHSTEYVEEMVKNTYLGNKNGGDIVADMGGMSMMLPYMVKSWTRNNKPEYKCKIWNFKVNSDEIERQKAIYNSGSQFVSTNDILTSWLFKMNPKADFIQLAVDLRERLPSIKEDMAGNYLGLLLLKNKDIENPMMVRKQIGQRLKATPEGYQGDGEAYQELPGYKAIRKYCGGISTNWTRFYKPIRLDGMSLDYTLPTFDDTAVDMKMMGITMTMEDNVVVFKCNDDEYGVCIFSASSRITEEMLMKDPMLGEKLF